MSRILWILFNLSLSTGIFPSKWKSSIVTPIYKSGNKSHIVNYRPISIQNVMPKILDNIVADKLLTLTKNIIINEQHGFIPGRSALTNLTVFSTYIVNEFENGHQIDVIYTDLRKAFDTVNHDILINKLFSIGITGNMLTWLSSYLRDRTQSIKYRNTYSRKIIVPSGVPQGSHLGPILFAIFINDIALVLKHCRFLLYADDLKLFLKIESPTDAFNLQQDINNLNNWCDSNHIFLNIQKCKIMRFHRNNMPALYRYSIDGTILNEVFVMRDLGIIFTPNLSFVEHYKHIIFSASKALGLITRMSANFSNPTTFRILYTALVLPHLEYCSPIWNPYQRTYVDSIERIQHRFLRFISHKLNQPIPITSHNYDSLLASLGFLTLEQRRLVADVTFVYKVMNNHVNCPDIVEYFKFNAPPKTLRKLPLFHTPICRTNYAYYSCINRICRHVNAISHLFDLFCDSLTEFKTHIRNVIRNLSQPPHLM